MQAIFLNCWKTSRSIACFDERVKLFLSEVWVSTGFSMNRGESVDGVAPSIPVSRTFVVRQGTWKESRWAKGASDCAERVAQGSWEVRSAMGACLLNRLDLPSWVHVHQLLCPPSSAARANDTGHFSWFLQFRSQLSLPLDQEKDGFNSR